MLTCQIMEPLSPVSLPSTLEPQSCWLPTLSLSMDSRAFGSPASFTDETDDDSLAEFRPLFSAPKRRGADDVMNEIIEGIFVGSADAVADAVALTLLSQRRKQTITIINCATASEVPLDTPIVESGIEMLRVEMEDSHEALLSMRTALCKAAALVQHYHTSGHIVLVVCRRGMSRSVSTVLAYMMEYERYALKSAMEAMRAARSVAYPNLGFWKILIEMELRVCDRQTIPASALRMHQAGREYKHHAL
jgi:protein-tyrosine phosphatase